MWLMSNLEEISGQTGKYVFLPFNTHFNHIQYRNIKVTESHVQGRQKSFHHANGFLTDRQSGPLGVNISYFLNLEVVLPALVYRSWSRDVKTWTLFKRSHQYLYINDYCSELWSIHQRFPTVELQSAIFITRCNTVWSCNVNDDENMEFFPMLHPSTSFPENHASPLLC